MDRLKTALSCGGSGPHLVRGFLQVARTIEYAPKRHLGRLSRFYTTLKHTDHATCDACRKGPHLLTECGRYGQNRLYRKRISKIGYGEELYLLDCYSAGVEIFFKEIKNGNHCRHCKNHISISVNAKIKKNKYSNPVFGEVESGG